MAEPPPFRTGDEAPPKATPCAECGQPFAPSDLIRLNDSWVCARCKPIAVQKLKEGLPPAAGMWRKDKQLVTRSETPFPDRCVKCNGPANGFKMRRTVYWHPPAYSLLILLNVLLAIIVIVIVRKKAVFDIGLCEEHIASRRRALWIGWAGTLGGVLLAVAAVVFHAWWLLLIAIVGCLTAMIYGAVKAPPITAAKITKDYVWIKGVSLRFMEGLPDWRGD